MAKIIGNTTATPNPRPDWNQTDETKADYIKNKPKVDPENCANALKKTVSDFGSIQLEDISCYEHTLDIKLESKNLVQNKGVDFSTQTVNGVTCEHCGDGTYHVYGETGDVHASLFIHRDLVLEAGTYTISGGINNVQVWATPGGSIYYGSSSGHKTFTLTETTELSVYLLVAENTKVDTQVSPMLEIGDAATNFTPWRDLSSLTLNVRRYEDDDINQGVYTFYPDTDGTVKGVKSFFSPRMYLTVEDNGIKITATYNQDTNIVINKLLNRIIALEAATSNNT